MNGLWEIEFSTQAEEELELHMAFYESKRHGLDGTLTAEIIEHLHAVVRFPYAQVRYDTIRCIPLKRFPFMIHFSVIEDRKVIRVQAIVHTSRNPNSSWGSDDWIVSEAMEEYLREVVVLEFESATPS